VSEGLADPQPLGDLAERQLFSVVDPDRFFVEDSRCVVRGSAEALGEPDGSVGAFLRTGHGADAGSGGAASVQRGVDLKPAAWSWESPVALIGLRLIIFARIMRVSAGMRADLEGTV